MRLGTDVYKQDGIKLAKDLLGKILVRKIDDRLIKCKIVETESYIGPEDKGCHAYKNKRTKRTEVMFWEGGHAYIYLIYGMYNCLNIVANCKDKPEAVLIRGVEPLSEIETLKEKRNIKSNKIEDLTNGPGKLCKALEITKELNGYDLIHGDELYIVENDEEFEIVEAKRINIDYAQEYKDKLWRFYIKNNKFVSKKSSTD
ncbi:DNA-3-methyladenine glycosylase [Lutibacter sp. B2]|nr:DNA-3-methyladenine glycosylase [Lutibacter sp. B2]